MDSGTVIHGKCVSVCICVIYVLLLKLQGAGSSWFWCLQVYSQGWASQDALGVCWDCSGAQGGMRRQTVLLCLLKAKAPKYQHGTSFFQCSFYKWYWFLVSIVWIWFWTRLRWPMTGPASFPKNEYMRDMFPHFPSDSSGISRQPSRIKGS